AALVLGDQRLTYAELEESSNRLARMLSATGVGAGDRVALCTPKTPMAVVAMLGVLKAGGAYVPIDSSSPAPRVARIVESAEPALVLAARNAAGLLDGLAAEGALGRVGSLEEEPVEGERFESAFSA